MDKTEAENFWICMTYCSSGMNCLLACLPSSHTQRVKLLCKAISPHLSSPSPKMFKKRRREAEQGLVVAQTTERTANSGEHQQRRLRASKQRLHHLFVSVFLFHLAWRVLFDSRSRCKSISLSLPLYVVLFHCTHDLVGLAFWEKGTESTFEVFMESEWTISRKTAFDWQQCPNQLEVMVQWRVARPRKELNGTIGSIGWNQSKKVDSQNHRIVQKLLTVVLGTGMINPTSALTIGKLSLNTTNQNEKE